MRGLDRQLAVVLGFFLCAASACSSAASESGDAATEGAVDRAWAEAAECLTAEGYSVEIDRVGNNWGLVINGEFEEGREFDRLYDGCVGDAEAITLVYLRTQVPEGAERIELAAEFQSCLGSAGLEEPVAYDPNNPDSSAVLADAIAQLGYAPGDQEVADDPRFFAVLQCFDTYEVLFPDRFRDLN